MKTTLFFLLFSAMIFSACSKERRINRQLDGKWYATMYENIVISPQISYEFNFSKEKKGKGTGYNTISYPGFYSKTQFTYEINGETMKYMVQDSAGKIVTAHLNIVDHSKDRMVFVNLGNGKTTNLRAK